MVALTAPWFLVRSLVTGVGLGMADAVGTVVALAAGAVVLGLPASWLASAERTAKRLLAADAPRVASVFGALAALLGLLDALTQQAPSWDEALVHASAISYADGGLIGLLRSYTSNPWLQHGHPPLGPMLYGTIADLLGKDLFIMRLGAVALGALTTLLVVRIGERLYDARTGVLAACLFLSMPLVRRMASAAMNDIMVTFLFCLALDLCLRGGRRGLASAPVVKASSSATSARSIAPKVPAPATLAVAVPVTAAPTPWLRGVLLGVVVGAGLLTKYTMLVVFPVLLLLAVTARPSRGPLLLTCLAGVVSAAILAAWLALAGHLGILDQQRAWLAERAGSATRSARGVGYALDGLLSKAPSAVGLYMLPLLWLGLRSFDRATRRSDVFVVGWILLVFVPLLLTLPDNRYPLPAYPALAILAARGLPREDTPRIVLLALLLCASVLAYYALVDLRLHAFLFGSPYRR